jgi:hypothetical protein
MKNDMIGRGFTELSMDETTNISGGSFFSIVIDSVIKAFPNNGGVKSVLDKIEIIAGSIYQFFGLTFRPGKTY